MGDNIEWFNNFMEPKVKFHPSGFQDHINVHNSNLESDPNEK